MCSLTWFSSSFCGSSCIEFGFVQIVFKTTKSRKSCRASWRINTDSVIIWSNVSSTLYVWVFFFLFFNSLSLPSASCKSLFQCLLFKNPIVLKIEIEIFFHKKFSEHRYQILVVRLFIEFELPTIIQHGTKLLWIPLAQVFNACNSLFYFDLLIFLFFGFCRQSLPRKSTPYKIH